MVVRFEDEARVEYREGGRWYDLPVRRLAVRRFPYHVIYLESADAVRVLAIAHDRRQPGYWRDRLRSL